MGQGYTIKKTIDPELIAVKFEEQVVLGKKKKKRDFLQIQHANFLAQDADTLKKH